MTRRTALQVSPGPSAPRENLWDLRWLFPLSTDQKVRDTTYPPIAVCIETQHVSVVSY